MPLEKRTLLIISIGLLSLSCLFFIISNGLPSWGTKTSFMTTETIGLWRICSPLFCITVPDRLLDGPTLALVIFARLFITLSCILTGLCTIALLRYLIQNIDYPDERLFKKIKYLPLAFLLLGIAGFAFGIGFIKYDDHLNEISLGAAAIFAIIAILFELASGIVILRIRSDCYSA